MKSDFLKRQRNVWNQARTSFLSIDLESSSDYLTGRTLTLAVDNWSYQVKEKEADPSGMGRWSSITLVGKKNMKVTVCDYGLSLCMEFRRQAAVP
jgi:hypothetical protein